MTRLTATATEDCAPQRMDRVALALFPAIASLSQARKLARKGRVWLNGEPCGPMAPIQVGDELAIELPEPRASNFHLDLDIVFEDEHLAVVYKPAGLVTSGNRRQTLVNSLPGNLAPSPQPDAMARPHPVHRLDARTQGLVAVAKTHRANVGLGHVFHNRQVVKRYRALLRGALHGEGVVEDEVDGRSARSRWCSVEVTPAPLTDHLTTVDLWPETGRKHQLRVHMAILGHPVLGDAAYTEEGPVLKSSGLFLAAVCLRLPHPVSGEPLEIEVPEPDKFARFRERARRRVARWQG